MAVTLQQIADKAGVSRGTVDRALNNRGRIRPEVAENIRRIAKEMGYRTNKAGRAMSMAKKYLNIGVIVQSTETPFMQEVLKGVEEAKSEVEGVGGTVNVHKITGIDAEKVIQAMDELKREKFHAIALMPSDDQLLRQKINQFVREYNIPIVTFNADIEDSDRLCYVGQNGKQSGRAAAGLLGELVGEEGKVCIVSGYENNNALNNRVKGFLLEIANRYPEIQVIGPRYTYDDNWVAEKLMEEILELHSDIRGVYIAGHSEKGVCECLRKTKRKIKVVANDVVEENMHYLEEGTINFLIDQDPFSQGYEPTMILYRLLLEGDSPEREFQYTNIVIKTRYNI